MKFKQFTLLLLSFLMTASVALAQRTITGKITDGKEALIGASIVAKGTSKGTATGYRWQLLFVY